MLEAVLGNKGARSSSSSPACPTDPIASDCSSKLYPSWTDLHLPKVTPFRTRPREAECVLCGPRFNLYRNREIDYEVMQVLVFFLAQVLCITWSSSPVNDMVADSVGL